MSVVISQEIEVFKRDTSVPGLPHMHTKGQHSLGENTTETVELDPSTFLNFTFLGHSFMDPRYN